MRVACPHCGAELETTQTDVVDAGRVRTVQHEAEPHACKYRSSTRVQVSFQGYLEEAEYPPEPEAEEAPPE